MLRFILFFFFLAYLSLQGIASVKWIVCNQRSEGSHYWSIQTAIEHANPYDTIFVKGSPVNYGNVLLEKPLVLVAEGSLYGELPGNSAKLTRILLTSNPFRRTISSGSSIIGFEFPYFAGFKPNIITVSDGRTMIRDITLEKNWIWFIHIKGDAQNWTFRNNIIRGWVHGGSTGEYRNVVIRDFFFHNNIINSIRGFEHGKIELHHNIITGRLMDVSGALIQNNIFTREAHVLENVYGCTFRGNIAVSYELGSADCFQHPGRFESLNTCKGLSNNGSGNRVGVDPGFVYWPSNDIMGGSVFKLRAGSGALTAGINGQQAGIFGGHYPFPENAFRNLEMEDPFPSFITSIY
jgi:hypothetical protein